MDYNDIYIKYKNKYLELKYNNMIGGKNNEIVIVLFGGSFSSKVRWQYAFEGKSTLRKIDFMDELKKIGNVYSFNYEHFNLNYYANSPNKEEAKMWKKIIDKYQYFNENIDFSIEDLDYKNICSKTYNIIKNMYGDNKKYIVIGHSYGGSLALLFSKLYKNECILCCCLDNPPYVEEFYKEHNENDNKNILEKYKNNKDLQNSLDIVKKTKDQEIRNNEIDNLFKFIMYKSSQDRIKYLSKKLYVPTIFFKRQDDQWNKYNNKEKNQFKKDKNLKGYIVRKNVGHYIWENKDFSDLIIKTIKENI